MRLILASALALLALTPAIAQDAPKAACAAIDKALPAPYASWTNKLPQPIALRPADLALAQLTPGRAVTAKLALVSEVQFVTPPAAPPNSRGGMFEMRIDRPGRYAFALDVGAWVDVVSNGASVKSVDHGHAPPCSSIRKEVEFDLEPGRYVVQLAQSPTPDISILVTRLR